MSELDEAWVQGLRDAEARARAAGRKDIAAYLALRKANDLTRQIASDWLLGVFMIAAGEANRAGAAIQVSRDESHRFKLGNNSMVGSRIGLASGVRMLQVEVGWPRTPRDGFMRGGGLASARIKHLGIKLKDETLRLALRADGTPRWLVEEKHESQSESRELHEEDIKTHLAILLKVPQA